MLTPEPNEADIQLDYAELDRSSSVRPAGRVSVSQRLLLHPLIGKLVLALISAALLICSLPSPDFGWLAWIALVPLMIACDGVGPLRAAGIGFVSGFAGAFGIYNWMYQLPAFGWRHALVLATYVAFYPTLWCTTLAIFNRWRAPLIFTAPALWAVVEYLRANAGFLALPWGTLAHAQHDNLPILQIASIAGEHGVIYLVALGNAAIASAMLTRAWRGTVMAALVIVSTHAWGAYVLYAERPGPMIRIAAIQPNIQIAERESKEGTALSFKRLERLSKSAATSNPELIVWPESAVAGNLLADRSLVATLQSLSVAVGAPIVVGAAEVQKFTTGERQLTTRSRVFNSAFLMQPGDALSEPYRKRRLLPFGEYMPYEKIMTWPQWLAPRVSEMTPGDNPYLFNLPDGTKVGALICWENLFADLARESVNHGAQILVQLTNDVWFGNTAAPLQHNLASIMRAVENRVPVVIASNSGPSQIIDAYGRVVAVVPAVFNQGIASGRIIAGSGNTVYGILGDYFVLVNVSGIGLYVVFGFVRKPARFR